MRRPYIIKFALLGIGTLLALCTSLITSAASTQKVYVTFGESMTVRRYLQPGDPGYKNDGYLREYPGLSTLPSGTIVEFDSNYTRQSRKQLSYFRANGRSNRDPFFTDFKVVYAPGLTRDQINALNADMGKTYLLRDSVAKYRSTTQVPSVLAPQPRIRPDFSKGVADAAAETPLPATTNVTTAASVDPQSVAAGTTEEAAAPVSPAAPASPAAVIDTGTPAPSNTALNIYGSDEPQFLELSDRLSVRKPTSDSALGGVESYLPKGTVIKIKPSDMTKGSNFHFTNNQRKDETRDFVTGFEVVSAPGMDAAQIKALNEKLAANPHYVAQSYVTSSPIVPEPTVAAAQEISEAAETESGSVDVEKCDGSPECARTSAVVTPLPTGSGLCTGFPPEAVAGCEKFLKDKSIPQDALKYTLEIYRNNINGLRMNKCVLGTPSDHYSVPDDFHKADLLKGIKNKCQVMINDTRAKQGALRGTFHFLNLCTGDKRTGYFNLGTRTFSNDYQNICGKRTTVLGAFLTADEDFLYTPSDRDYAAIKKRFGGGAPAVAVFGLQNTNNRSANCYKYIHVSPYKSSWGCPSISPENGDLIAKLADNGPSLVVNYGPENKMEDPSKCTP